jgi:hypothetical protein
MSSLEVIISESSQYKWHLRSSQKDRRKTRLVWYLHNQHWRVQEENEQLYQIMYMCQKMRT